MTLMRKLEQTAKYPSKQLAGGTSSCGGVGGGGVSGRGNYWGTQTVTSWTCCKVWVDQATFVSNFQNMDTMLPCAPKAKQVQTHFQVLKVVG